MIKSASEAVIAVKDEHVNQVPSTLNHTIQSPYAVHEALPQCTLKKSACIEGVGLNGQKKVHIELHPAPPSTGIVFRRVDLPSASEVQVTPHALEATEGQMNAKHDDTVVQNISHLMSAFAGLGIDNAYIDVNSDEVPYLDGSADTFSFLIRAIGIQTQPFSLKRFIRIKDTIYMGDHTSWLKLTPFNGYAIECQDEQAAAYKMVLSPRLYLKELSRARHAVLTSAHETLRYPNEAQRHYMLDVIGDLYALGATLMGAVTCYKPSHTLNHKLMDALLKQPNSWEYTEFLHSEQASKHYQ